MEPGGDQDIERYIFFPLSAGLVSFARERSIQAEKTTRYD